MRRCAIYGAIVFGMMLLLNQSFAQQTHVGRDPTQPAMGAFSTVETEEKETKPEEAYHLASIIISPTRRLALINATFVKVGDKIGEASVVKINRNSVSLLAPGKKITIYLLDQRGWE